jgi:hypothetical protein
MDRMNTKILRETIAARRPFKLFLTDGRTLKVPHPEFVAIFPSERTILVGKRSGKVETLDLSLVVSMEEIRELPLSR